MKLPFPTDSTRSLIAKALPDNVQESGGHELAPGFTYVPQSHALALDPDISIVEGIRGAGKTFWWMTIFSKTHRTYLATAFEELAMLEKVEVSQGFGLVPSDLFPGKDTINQMVRKMDPRDIWRAVIGSNLKLPKPFPDDHSDWIEKSAWVRDNPSSFDRILKDADGKLGQRKTKALILFDSLERLAADWAGIRPILKPLFQVALDIRSYANIRIKLFVRPDMVKDEALVSFPDASKLLSKNVTLTWRRADLYALLFQRLGNVPDYGEEFRRHCLKEFGLEWRNVGSSPNFVIPTSLRSNEEKQKELFHAISGPTMARGESGHKRGYPYSWLPNHLMDGHEQVSPRSFLAALKEAASEARDTEWGYALDYKAIQTGVKKASEIRKNEIVTEDYPWVSQLMTPLKKAQLIVPCEIDEIIKIWAKEKAIDSLSKKTNTLDSIGLPPRHIDEGPKGVLQDLAELGFINYLSDNRIQMPDVYRIAFGLGRKGGVPPLK